MSDAKLMPVDFDPPTRRTFRGRKSDKYKIAESARIAKSNPGRWVQLAGPITDVARRHTLASSIRKGKRRQVAPEGAFEAVTSKDVDHVFIRYTGESD